MITKVNLRIYTLNDGRQYWDLRDNGNSVFVECWKGYARKSSAVRAAQTYIRKHNMTIAKMTLVTERDIGYD